MSLPRAADYNVIVAGGGMVGTAAAIGSAWRGALCASRPADSDRKAGAAIRVMGMGMATGHAAGICAAMLAGGTYSPAAVREQLRKAGAILDEGEVLA